jgi:hypothetical protein
VRFFFAVVWSEVPVFLRAAVVAPAAVGAPSTKTTSSTAANRRHENHAMR